MSGELKINGHVTALNRFMPFDAGFDQLYEEHVREHNVQLRAQALDAVASLLRDDVGSLRLVLLTGDAGHGKTYVCRHLLRAVVDFDSEAAYEAIRTKDDGSTSADGTVDLANLPSGRTLRLVRDLSESDEDTAAARLVDSLADPSRTTVVCANEGRLRVAIGRRREELHGLGIAVDRALQFGAVRTGEIAVVDLNRQSVAGESSGRSLVDDLLQAWVVDRRRWATCQTCAAAPGCPIRRNHRLLSEDAIAPSRRASFSRLLRLVELGGTTVTIREMLAVTALAITGGLSCSDVHRRVGRSGWQARHLFFEATFGQGRRPDEMASLRVLRELARLDPGRVGLRAVDDALIVTAGAAGNDDPFEPVRQSDLSSPVHSSKDARRVDGRQRRLVEYLRRAAFFDSGDALGDIAQRTGLRFAAEFERMAAGPAPRDTVPVRNQLLRGMEAIQGLGRRELGGMFVIVDPAFGSSGAARVVARTVELTAVKLRSQGQVWADSTEPGAGEIVGAVDWLDRNVVVEFVDGAQVDTLVLNLIEFEFLMRAAEGLADGGFFDGVVRRIRATLARLAEGQRVGAIQVVVDGQLRRLAIDVDGRITAGLPG